MILDTIAQGSRYESLHPRFKEAFAFLQDQDLEALEDGRYEIDGDAVYALVMSAEGRGKDGAKLEVHRAYIDIQVAVGASDVIGWAALDACANGQGFNEDKDVELFDDTATSWVTIPPGCFGVFFPADAHAPLACEGAVKKVVVKVAV